MEKVNEQEKIIIDNNSVKAAFKAHLDLEQNKRILFSAPFGAGKSYFVREFFEGDAAYINIKLFPVDYSVASNEDLLEIIKHDLLSALISYHEDALNLEENDFSKFMLIISFMMHKLDYLSTGKKLLSALLPGSAEAIDVAEEVKKVADSFPEYSKELLQDELDRIVAYIGAMKFQKGSIRETDGITAMIRDFVARIKENKGGLPFVLVIDDLDRLDPDHIFRLINIFTAHYDSQTETNKFGFDKIILVCDIDSLRHMFAHRYGPQANFNGYIDKFYSVKPFHFDNRLFLTEKIDLLLRKKMRVNQEGDNSREAANYLRAYGKDSDFYACFKDILVTAIEARVLKIRNFDRFEQYTLPGTSFHIHGSSRYSTNHYEFAVLIYQLKQFFADINELKSALEVLSSRFPADYSTIVSGYLDSEGLEKYLIRISLPFIINDKVIFKYHSLKSEEVENPQSFKNELGNTIYIHYEMNDRDDKWSSGVDYKFCSAQDVSKKIMRPNIFWILLQALEYCVKRNIV